MKNQSCKILFNEDQLSRWVYEFYTLTLNTAISAVPLDIIGVNSDLHFGFLVLSCLGFLFYLVLSRHSSSEEGDIIFLSKYQWYIKPSYIFWQESAVFCSMKENSGKHNSVNKQVIKGQLLPSFICALSLESLLVQTYSAWLHRKGGIAMSFFYSCYICYWSLLQAGA